MKFYISFTPVIRLKFGKIICQWPSNDNHLQSSGIMQQEQSANISENIEHWKTNFYPHI